MSDAIRRSVRAAVHEISERAEAYEARDMQLCGCSSCMDRLVKDQAILLRAVALLEDALDRAAVSPVVH